MRRSWKCTTFVEVHEVVEVDHGVVRPQKYSYYFVERDAERFGYDLDPTHEPAAHVHRGASHTSEPATVTTVAKVIEEAWETTSQSAESEGVRLLKPRVSDGERRHRRRPRSGR
jgi:hypothetical protein